MSDPLPAQLRDLVERFDHVALAVHQISDLVSLVELLGGRFVDGGDDARGGFRWAQFTVPGSKLELLQPLDPQDEGHFLVRFLASRGEGVHHLTFKITDLETAIARARRMGFEVVAVRATGAWKEAFLHPRSTHGVLIQLAQWDDRAATPGLTLDHLIGPAQEP